MALEPKWLRDDLNNVFGIITCSARIFLLALSKWENAKCILNHRNHGAQAARAWAWCLHAIPGSQVGVVKVIKRFTKSIFLFTGGSQQVIINY